MVSSCECTPISEAEKRALKIMQCRVLFCTRWEGITDVLRRASIALRILVHGISKKVYTWGMKFSVYHMAAKLMTEVAKQHETNLHWDVAAAQHLKLASCYLQLDNKSKAADAYFDAAFSYLKTNAKVEEAEKCFMRAMTLSLEIERLNMAASCYRELGKLQERNYNLGMAVGSFRNATDNFSKEDNRFLATQSRLKIAEFSAQLDDYHGAILIYEDIASQEVSSHCNLKEYYLDLAICHICNGSVDALQSALEEYKHHFSNTVVKNEDRFLKLLADAIVQDDPCKFQCSTQCS